VQNRNRPATEKAAPGRVPARACNRPEFDIVSNPEMVFFANLCVNLHVCLCGDLQVASAQTLDFLDLGKKSAFPDWKRVDVGPMVFFANLCVNLHVCLCGGIRTRFRVPRFSPVR